MRRFLLIRLDSNATATYGQLLDAEGKQVAVTLELPWRDNHHGTSCIPQGTYTARRRFSPKHHGEVFGLLDVPGRSDIEIHAGNTAKDSLGCILLGSAFGFVDDEHGVVESRRAVAQFMASLVGVDAFTLVVSDPLPPVAA